MTPEQREAVQANAKFLKQVRPIDPDEIHEYVEGQPHPSAVRQVLRESAVDLGLIEHADGTFSPAPDGTVKPAGTVDRFPEAYEGVLLDCLVDEYGIDWAQGETGNRLRNLIRQIKEDYFRGRPVTYDREAAFAYAIYHLPDSYATVRYVIDEIARSGALSRPLRILDVGAGVGGPALGLNDYLGEDTLVEYHAVEPSAAANLLEVFLEETSRNFHWRVHRETAEAFDPAGEFDIIAFVNVLSELGSSVTTVERYRDSLATDGSLVTIAPADLETSTGLRQVERELVDGLSVFSPTIRLWPDSEPGSRCWSFDVRPALDVPEFQRRLDGAGRDDGEFVNVDVQYSYAIFRKDGERRIDFSPDVTRFAKMAEMDRHVTDRIDLVAIKLSHDLSDDGHPLFLVGDGSESIDHYAVLTKETTLNRALLEAGYGSLLLLENVLALWNDDEEAYNLVVDGESIVESVR